ncbi:transposase [Lignipirellula cremea]|nr:transposase [Lignipirellula cremea]
MARTPRREVIDESSVGVFHCVNRCVRRAFLCGQDPVSGQDFDHRRAWIQRRMEFLAGEFGVEVLGFAVMSNHLHVILRTRPDVVAEWSDNDIALRWWNLFPLRREQDGSPAEPTEAELGMLLCDSKVLAERRQRLSSLSWFMRWLAEPIARRANKEDECTGRFWEGRYKCQPLLDEAALLACSVYVDLNPVRAGIAATPETSRHTSGYERIEASKVEIGTIRHSDTPNPEQAPRQDDWLSPIELDKQSERSTTRSARRASDRGYLSLDLTAYLKLLDWTGRQIRRGKRGSIPSDLALILERLQISADLWVNTVQNFRKLFHRAAGSPTTLAAEAARRGKRWLAGMQTSRECFAG